MPIFHNASTQNYEPSTQCYGIPKSRMNLSRTIIPKSDQLNSDDLIAGPLTIRITSVEAGSVEQPVSIHWDGESGRPYKPSKSMRRVLVSIWGAEADAYIGRRVTLYRDPAIKFGGDAVGGIRISHASDITEPVSIALTETRGRRKPFRVDPLQDELAVDIRALTDTGDAKAREGMDALKAWWATIPACAKTALKPTLDSAWKRTAEGVSEGAA